MFTHLLVTLTACMYICCLCMCVWCLLISSEDCAAFFLCPAQLHGVCDKTKTFFSLCRKDKSDLREYQYQQLCQVILLCFLLFLVKSFLMNSQEYDKALNESQDKIKTATQVYDLVRF